VLLAHEEARGLRHSYVGTEHILLALLREGDGPAASAMASSGVSHGQVRAAVVRMMGTGVEDPAGELPLTSAAETVLDGARRESSLRGQEHVGTEHILLALLEAQHGAAARILLMLDADPAAIRAQVAGTTP
jgi:ATP-dependent Clp protease ATP-binding subunit ClpC